ncbi:hypothetical protein FA09DRAFT_177728 [Tilletiopsis washingtonensis]|uniref:Uncharacterized protein n=1 Tax=Tilletiopsis washingtonensis TaxID=58919 RepID=A0A316YYI6_9BASI|nr:hypothetical protein FA09DRAFT_177728 [Tilletiopsis washingtonensis]PWN94560.1 hypothetical protein FA09DRAFT_177728 [Tilletiopsis washingtonensis]
MSAPPFPAPKGMRWSPSRKRFFPLNAPRSKPETVEEQTQVAKPETPTRTAATAASAFEQARAGPSCFGTTALRTAMPRSADPHRLINGRAANLRLRAVHSLLPYCTYQRPNITCLAVSLTDRRVRLRTTLHSLSRARSSTLNNGPITSGSRRIKVQLVATCLLCWPATERCAERCASLPPAPPFCATRQACRASSARRLICASPRI